MMKYWVPFWLFPLALWVGGCTGMHPAMPPLASIEGVPGHFGRGRIIDMKAGQSISFEQLMDQLQSRELIFVGEVHDNPEHHLIETQILQGLMDRHSPLAVGMEFFDKSRQPILDQYMAGEVSETVFLKDVGWDKGWSFPYHFYRPIIFVATKQGRALLGLNVPHPIVRKVARSGLESLTPEERSQAAEEIDLSNQEHRKALKDVFEQHTHEGIKDFDYFYQAQCVWDETMAENIARYLKDRKGTMVVFTGNGHIINGYGIPERVLRRIPVRSATIVLRPLTGRTTLSKEMADYVWLTSDSSAGGFRMPLKKRPLQSKRSGSFCENQVSDTTRSSGSEGRPTN